VITLIPAYTFAQPLTRARVRDANIQPYLKTFIKHTWMMHQTKIINNCQIIAESTYRGDIYFYDIDIADEYLEDVLRHEIGHLAYWSVSTNDPYQNTEDKAERFKELSKRTNSLRELMLYMGYWKVFWLGAVNG
jgi:hypothetical protein